MKLTKSKFSFFSKDFASEDDRLLQYAKAGLENPDNIPDIVCNIGGQDYQAEKVEVDEYADSYVIEAKFEQMEPAQPLEWQCGDIIIELGK